MTKIKKSPDAATGTTTANKDMKKLGGRKMYNEEVEYTLQSIKECIVKRMQPIAEVGYKFDNAVNEITKKEAGFEDYISSEEEILNGVSNLCDTIITSRMSFDKKSKVLLKLFSLIRYIDNAGAFSEHTDNEKDWDEYVRLNADYRIEEYKNPEIKQKCYFWFNRAKKQIENNK
jgi:hypothetical protein